MIYFMILYLLLTDFFLSELDYIWIFTFAFAINDGSMKISVFDFVSWPKKGNNQTSIPNQ